jgi:hypothetical protein
MESLLYSKKIGGTEKMEKKYPWEQAEQEMQKL